MLLSIGGCKRAAPPPHAAPTAAPEAKKEGAPESYTLRAESIARYGITTEPAAARVLEPTFITPARVAFNAETMAHIGAPLRGRVVELKVKLGSAVKAGDVLLVIDSPDLGEAQSDFLVKRTTAKSSAPAAEFAKTDWERGQALMKESQGVSEGEVRRREAAYNAATALVQNAQAAATAAEDRLHLLGMSEEAVGALAASGKVSPRLSIAAPTSGQVVAREVTLGELVGPDRASLLTLADTGTLWVLADVPEARLHEVAIGAKAWVKVGAAAAARSEGTVAFISPMLDAATRTAQVRIEVAGGTGALRPGMFAEVEITAHDPSADATKPALSVPEGAVQNLGGKTVVFVPAANDATTFTPRLVTVGKPVGRYVPVLAGLREGERVVTTGSFILKAHATQTAESAGE